ncbi:MAG: hypothetical protein R2794_01355 [Chitinophagales bacterium]
MFKRSIFIALFLGISVFAFTQKNTAPAPSYPQELYSGLHWRNVGPMRAGRCIAVTGTYQDNKTYYAGAVGGGLWKTTDGGNNWNCVSDTTFHSSSVGAVEVSRSNANIIYVGMGEVEMRGNISFGDGMYKSIDGGKSWKHIGLQNTYAIGNIAIDPLNPDIVYVAAQGHNWGPNPERGLYKSIDGGNTWTRILQGPDDTTGCADVKIDPNNPNTIYASMWKAYRTPYSLSSGGKGSGLYKSTDAGKTWKLISENPGMPKGLNGKIIVTISSLNPERLWASVENIDNAGIYTSYNGGDTWELLTKENDLIQRPWYFSNIYVDPQNDNELFILSVEYWRSNNGGNSFYRANTNTWDNHVMWINPMDANNYIVGGDGGPTITFDDGATWSETDIPTGQFYHVNIDDAYPYNLYGAQQDNSSLTIRSRVAGYNITERDWHAVAGGEAGYIVPDPTNNHITYGGEYDGIFSSYNEDNDIYRIISIEPEQHYGAGAITAQKRFNWTFPIAFSPNNPKCLYATSNYVHRSFDGGVSWETISPDLTRNDPKTLQSSGGPVTKDNTGVEYYATIFAFAESPVQAGVLWTGSDDGLVYVSKDNGAHWDNVTPANLPEWSMISYVEPSWFDAGTCYLSATRYKLDDMHPYIYKTTDYGKTWTKIVNGLPADMYNRCVRNDPNKKGLLFAGLETGVYVSFDDGAHWQSLQLNLPVTPVVDLHIHKGERDVVIATHGRSFWILDDITPLYDMYDAQHDTKKNYLFSVLDAYRTPGPNWSTEGDESVGGENEPVGVKVRYYLADNADKELRMVFLEADGDTIITYSNVYDKKRTPITTSNDFYEDPKHTDGGKLNGHKGQHQFVWDMRYPDAKGDTSATFEASLFGPLAVPGNYMVVLFLGDDKIGEQAFAIRIDPRNPATVADLQAQFDLNKKICDKLNEIAAATAQIRSIIAQIDAYAAEEKDAEKRATFVAKGEVVKDSLTAIQERLYNPKVLAYEDNLKFPIQLEEKIAGLNYFLQMADTGPTKTMLAKYNDLNARIQVQLDLLHAIVQNEVPALNKIAGSTTMQAIMLE